jgi:small subunit ribosomal protein S4e
MSSKGEKKKSKSLSVPKSVHIHRKEKVWSVKTKAGPHKKDAAVPLGIVLRDLIGIARNMKEAHLIMDDGSVKVDGVIRKDHQFSVGLFDIISIEAQKKAYRILIDKRGRLFVKEIEENKGEKLCKVAKKKMVNKGIQITTNDGRVFLGVDAKVGDSLKIIVPGKKVESVISMKNGALVYITSGSHSGEKAEVLEIITGTPSRERMVKLKTEDKEFETIAKNVFVIGEKTAEIEELK